MSSYNRGLIEQARKVNKLLSLYVLALQEETTFTTDNHNRLANALRGVASTVEQEGRKQQAGGPSATHVVAEV